MKKILPFLMACMLLVGCNSNEYPKDLEEQDFTATHTGTIIVDNSKEIKFELYGDEAPITVENFVNLANDGFYDGLIFHRVMLDFMIQGGCPDGTGAGGSDTQIKGEFSKNDIENPILHTKGVLSMARLDEVDSATSQFFIVQKDSPHLDGSYAAFGKVTEGLDVVDEIAAVEVAGQNKPTTDVIITSVTID